MASKNKPTEKEIKEAMQKIKESIKRKEKTIKNLKARLQKLEEKLGTLSIVFLTDRSGETTYGWVFPAETIDEHPGQWLESRNAVKIGKKNLGVSKPSEFQPGDIEKIDNLIKRITTSKPKIIEIDVFDDDAGHWLWRDEASAKEFVDILTDFKKDGIFIYLD